MKLCLGGYRSPVAAGLRMVTMRKRKKSPAFQAGDHYAFRTREGIICFIYVYEKVLSAILRVELSCFRCWFGKY